MLFDPQTGTPTALVDGTLITAARTAAASAVATRALARADADGHGDPRHRRAGARPRARGPAGVPRAARDHDRGSRPARGASARARAQRRARARAPRHRAPRRRSPTRSPMPTSCARRTHSADPVVRREWLTPGVHVNSVGFNTAGREVDARDGARRARRRRIARCRARAGSRGRQRAAVADPRRRDQRRPRPRRARRARRGHPPGPHRRPSRSRSTSRSESRPRISPRPRSSSTPRSRAGIGTTIDAVDPARRPTNTGVAMPEVELDDVTIAYEVTGEGEPVVLVCGCTQPALAWQRRPRARARRRGLSGRHLRQPGIAPSSSPPAPYSVADMVGDARRSARPSRARLGARRRPLDGRLDRGDVRGAASRPRAGRRVDGQLQRRDRVGEGDHHGRTRSRPPRRRAAAAVLRVRDAALPPEPRAAGRRARRRLALD